MDDRKTDPMASAIVDYHNNLLKVALLAMIEVAVIEVPIEVAQVLREVAAEYERKSKMPF